MLLVIRRLYVHNFRCLENFELPLLRQSSVLLIGKNGSGKTTVALALEILQKIARGTNRVGELVRPKDLSQGRASVPMRFEIEVELQASVYSYTIAFEFPDGFKELRVSEERLTVNDQILYSREIAQVHLARTAQENQANFVIDWHLVALPIIQQKAPKDPSLAFKQWLARMIILRPVPPMIEGDSTKETLEPDLSGHDFADWFSGVIALSPSAYTEIDSYLKQVMEDFKEIKNPLVGNDSRSLQIQFSDDKGAITLPFGDLSDGEKCFMICALVLAANKAYGPLFCFWDEPDNYLALSEVGDFILALRRGFQTGGQLVATSHNQQAIQRFSNENTLVLTRKTHLEPTVCRRLADIHLSSDLVGALVRGDLEP